MLTRLMNPTTIVLLVVLAIPAGGLAAEAQPASGIIEGSVQDAGGKTLSTATVVLLPAGPQVAVDAEGRFRLTGLTAGTYQIEARAPGHVIETLAAVEVEENEITEVRFDLAPVSIPLDEIVVSARYTILRDEPIASIALDRQEIQQIPHFGDDLFRAISVLPSTTANDFSARFNVRGGHQNEVLVRLDGLELFEPFHLKDFQGVFNTVDPEVIGAVDLLPGSFPSEYGDRMSGVLDMTSARPAELKTTVGISFSNAWVGSSGTFADSKGRWLGSARRGYLDVILSLADGGDEGDDGGQDPKPRYWDAFGKLDYDLSPRQSLSIKAVGSDDSLEWEDTDPDEEVDVNTGYGNAILGLEHLALLGSSAVVDTVLSATHVDRDRDISAAEAGDVIALLDDRNLDILGIRQDWNFDLSDRNYLKWGFEARRMDTSYDYFNRIVDNDFIDDPRFPPPIRTTRFEDEFDEAQYSIYAADRWRMLRRLTTELGVRYDRQTLTDESQVSPRINLVVDLGRESVLRVGWGHFYQSQRPHELRVQFGETEFQPAERAEHLTLGFERLFANGYRFRADAYRRLVTDPQRRWETLWDPFSPVPEAHADLIEIAPDEVVADGLEIYFKGPTGERFDWWMTYVLSSIKDELVDGSQYRSIDQTHALRLNFNYRASRKWNLSWAWIYHTGWPTTAVSAVLIPESEGPNRTEWDIGPFYAERLDDYHRLDLRASRSSRVGKGRLTVFLDVQNLYDRQNPRGLAIDDRTYVGRPDGNFDVLFGEESWFGIMPSFGISYQR